jgi:TolA-binding protein
MQKKYENKEMVLLALSDEPLSKVQPFVKKENMNYIVGADAKATFKTFGVKAYPTMLVVDRGGKVAYKGHDFDQAEKAVESALKAEPSSDPPEAGPEDEAANAAYKKALKLYKKKDYGKALKAFQDIVKEYKGTQAAKKAGAKVKKIKASKKMMAKVQESGVTKKCEDWLDLARSLARGGKNEEATRCYQRIIDEYPDSSFADIARKEMTSL